MFRLTYRPDPPSLSDFSFDLARPLLAGKLGAAGDHHIPEHTPISNQGGAGSCAANACGDGQEIVLGVQRAEQQPSRALAPLQISRRHIYWLARSLDGTTSQDDGTYIRSCLTQMRNIGVCDEKYMPYSDQKIFQPPSLEAKVRASENKITGFYRIDDSSSSARLNSIATAVRANHPVVFGTTVGDNLQKYQAGSYPLVPITTGVRGGHAMLVTGVVSIGGRYRFLVRNSWGVGWGDKGYAWFDQDYLSWSETRDLWMLTTMKELL